MEKTGYGIFIHDPKFGINTADNKQRYNSVIVVLCHKVTVTR